MDGAAIDETDRQALTSGVAGEVWRAVLDSGNGSAPGPAQRDHSPMAGVGRPGGGSLTVIGTGIRTVGQLTLEAIAWIRASDVVLYLVADPVAEEVIGSLNPDGAMSLKGYYGEGVPRRDSYEAMVNHMLGCVRAGQHTCVALYGHPGVFAYPSHEAIRRARAEGYLARMLPGISAEDCLFADLGVDPAVSGCQSFEATDFLVHDRVIDPTSQLILWQVGVVGDWTYRAEGYDLRAFPLLVARLSDLYGPMHEGYIYEAAILPGLSPTITKVTMGGLTPESVNAGSTLYVPPAYRSTVNHPIAEAIGIVR